MNVLMLFYVNTSLCFVTMKMHLISLKISIIDTQMLHIQLRHGL